VHPVDEVSLLGAIKAAEAKLIVPVLVGPKQKIQAAAIEAKVDLSPYELVATEHSHAAGAKAVGPQGRSPDEGKPPHRRIHGRDRS
jgi:phosphate acetyltransferase